MDYLIFFCVLSMTTLFVNFTKDLTNIVILAFTKVRKKDTYLYAKHFELTLSDKMLKMFTLQDFKSMIDHFSVCIKELSTK